MNKSLRLALVILCGASVSNAAFAGANELGAAYLKEGFLSYANGTKPIYCGQIVVDSKPTSVFATIMNPDSSPKEKRYVIRNYLGSGSPLTASLVASESSTYLKYSLEAGSSYKGQTRWDSPNLKYDGDILFDTQTSLKASKLEAKNSQGGKVEFDLFLGRVEPKDVNYDLLMQVNGFMKSWHQQDFGDHVTFTAEEEIIHARYNDPCGYTDHNGNEYSGTQSCDRRSTATIQLTIQKNNLSSSSFKVLRETRPRLDCGSCGN